MKKHSRGFTLIELLVVIAIIGMLAAVVLASLNSARDKGANAAKKSSVNNIRAQAEIVYDNAGDYAAVCADATVTNAFTAAAGDCADDAAGWGVETLLSTGEYYCVDSTGGSGEYAAATIAEGSDYTCN
jgi:prepilin-type N-terminal cleavage/methylation domain-containing protein